MLTQMIGQGGWDVYVTGVNGFVGKEHGQPLIIKQEYELNNNFLVWKTLFWSFWAEIESDRH